jgi:DNA-binding transcriptional LysR family regulator
MAKVRLEEEVGRKLKFRDLRVFFAVVEAGSMAGAAAQLGLTQPAVSEIIAQLERLFRVRLFDRSTRGVEATLYGQAFLARSRAALDEMKQSVKDMEFLTDPTAGEVHIGCAQRLSAAFLPQVVERFSRAHPRVHLQIGEEPPSVELSGLRERKYDLVVARLVLSRGSDVFGDDINVDVLFDDRLVVACGKNAPWARRRKIDIAELSGERWILTAPETSNYLGIAEAFRQRGLATPETSIETASVHIVTHLLAASPYVTAISKIVADRLSLHVLPIDLPVEPWPAAVMTLKRRTLSPVAQRFIECAHAVAHTYCPPTHERPPTRA